MHSFFYILNILACLKHERDNLNCEGHGEDMWPCKRTMVSNCLDKNEDFEGMGSDALVELVAEFREGLAEYARSQMEMDVGIEEPQPTEDPNAILGVESNSKGKVKVNSLVKALQAKKRGKQNYLADQTFSNEEEEEEEDEREYEGKIVFLKITEAE